MCLACLAHLARCLARLALCKDPKEAIWSLMKKKENKKEKVTESLHLLVKIERRLNENMTLVSETSDNQNNCGNHKAALNDKPTDSPQ